MEILIMNFVGVLIVNALFFGVISAIGCMVRNIGFFYFSFIAIVSFLSGSIIYLGWSIHNMGYWPIWFLVLAAFVSMAWVIWEYLFINIPADPPNIGVVTIWGKRIIGYARDTHDELRPTTVNYVGEGLRLYFPYFPFFVNYNVVNMIKRNKEFSIIVWCKRAADPSESNENKGVQMGAQMKVTGSYTWTPDVSRLYQFLQTGEDKGIDQILPDVIEEEAREVAQENYWEDFLGLQQEITNRIIKKVTDEDTARCIVNGSSDVQEMGTLLYRFNIKAIDPVDEDLKNSVTAFSRETRERQAEIYEMQTEVNQAAVLVDKAKEVETEISIQDAYALIKRYKLAREGKINARHFSFEGLESIAPVLEAILSKKSSIIK